MADSILLNQATIDATYDASPVAIGTNALSTTLISGLTATKSASSSVWLSGNLTYTIVIDNQAGEDLVNPVITDQLDISQVEFITGSVKIDGTPTSNYTHTVGGLLTITVPTVTAGTTTTVTFQVSKL